MTRCTSCSRTYGSIGRYINLIPNPPPPDDLAVDWSLWEQLQDNGEISYAVSPEGSLSVGKREDASAFAEFSQLEGLVLDVGCGPQGLPSYGADFPGTLVGVDPLAGNPSRDFLFAIAIGEYLPFGDGTFDRVLFATSLDHVMDPARALREARRVVKASGTVNLWFGLVQRDRGAESCETTPARTSTLHKLGTALNLVREGRLDEFKQLTAKRIGLGGHQGVSTAYLAEITVPNGAIDQFHAFHLDVPLAEQLLSGAGLDVLEMTEWHDGNVFARCRQSTAPDDR